MYWMQWIRENVTAVEQLLGLKVMWSRFYSSKSGIFWVLKSVREIIIDILILLYFILFFFLHFSACAKSCLSILTSLLGRNKAEKCYPWKDLFGFYLKWWNRKCFSKLQQSSSRLFMRALQNLSFSASWIWQKNKTARERSWSDLKIKDGEKVILRWLTKSMKWIRRWLTSSFNSDYFFFSPPAPAVFSVCCSSCLPLSLRLFLLHMIHLDLLVAQWAHSTSV